MSTRVIPPTVTEAGKPPVVLTRVAMFFPNGQFSKRVVYAAHTRDPYEVETPDDCYAIQFHTVLEIEVKCDIDIEGDYPLVNGGERVVYLRSEEIDPSPFYFIRGKRLRRSEVAERYGEDHLIHRQMEVHDVKDIIAFGDYVTPFNKAENHIHLRDYVSRTTKKDPE